MTGATPKPPKAFQQFSSRYPKIAEAWGLLGEAGASGPLDEKTQRIVKLAVAIGARSEGATHSAVRKALAAGVSPEALQQVVALAASTLGLPQAVAAFTWIEDELKVGGRKAEDGGTEQEER
jgi:alkylhydroperoxidase/carboxymuconolactone decarboxylase family protein YurZ